MNQKKKILDRKNSTRTRLKKKSAKDAPKIEPLPGYLMAQYKRCGRGNCKCTRGSLHGPYYYRTWTAGGMRQKIYVPKNRVQTVSEQISEYRKLRAQEVAQRQDFKLLLTEIKQESKRFWAAFNLARKESPI